VIEDRQPRRGFRDNATEHQQFEGDGTDPAWPTAGHRPPGYEDASEAYAYEPSGRPADPGYPEDESSGRRAAHADGDRDDADDLQYGPPSDRYSALADLAYDPRGQASPPARAHDDGEEQHPYAARRSDEEQPHPYAGQRYEEPEPHPYAAQRYEQPEPHPYAAQRYEQPEPHPYAAQRYEQPEPHPHAEPPFDEEDSRPLPFAGRRYEEPPRDERFEPPPGPVGSPAGEEPPGHDAHAAYRRGYGEDEQATAVYSSSTAVYPSGQQEPADQGGGVPWGPPPLPGAPVPMPDAEAGPGQPTDVIDLTAPRVLPRTHRGEQRKRALILVVAAVGVLLAGGVGYAVFGTGSSSDSIPAGAAPAEEASDEDPDPVFPDESNDPGADTEATTPSRTAGAPSSVSPTTARSTRQAPSNPRTTATTRNPPATHLPTIPTPHPTTKKPTIHPTSKPPSHTPPSTPPSTSPSVDPPESTPSTG
jgi:hypothetical protein